MEAREFLRVIALQCPSYRVPLPDCPLAIFRKDTNPEAIGRRLETISDDEAEDLVRQHFLCVCRKDGCGT